MKKQINIMLIEDSPAYRKVIDRTLGNEPNITLANQFGTAEIALRSLQNSSPSEIPDLILLDLNLPGISGLEALPWIKKYAPKTQVIILTQSNKEADIVEAISQGATGYLLKSNTLEQLTAGIQTVMDGGASLDPSVAKFIMGTLHKTAPVASENKALSKREMEVLALISEGLQKKRSR